jgi:hypothetical protein
MWKMRFCRSGLQSTAAVLVGVMTVSAVQAVEPGKSTTTIYNAAERAVAKGNTEKTRMVGFSIINTEFTEVPRDGAILIGFDLGLGKDNEAIYAIRPVYRTAAGEITGAEQGLFRTKDGSSKKEIKTKVVRTVSLRARQGYAVGAITLRTGLSIHGMSVKFMAIKGTSLDPRQSYDSEWIGDSATSGTTLTGKGAPIVGIHGNKGKDAIVALGLITMQPPSDFDRDPAPQPRAEPAAPPKAEAGPAPAAGVPVEHVIDKYFDHENNFSLTIPPGWQRMGKKELDQIRQFVRQRGLDNMVNYTMGFRPNGGTPGTFPYILVQVFAVQTEGLTYQEITDKLSLGIDEPLKIVEEKLPELVSGLTAGKPVLDKSHNRIVIRLSSDVFGVGRAEAISMCHLGKNSVVAIHCYAKEDEFERRLPKFMDINNSFFFDDGYEFVAAKQSSAKGASSTMLFLVLGGVVLGAAGVFAAFIGRARTASARPAQSRKDSRAHPMALPVHPETGIQSRPPPKSPPAKAQE